MPFVIDQRTGHARHVSDDFLVADDLDGKDAPLVIERVESKEATLQEGRHPERIHVYFAGRPKPLLLNATNARSIIALYGKRAKDWTGKTVTLYPTVCKMKGLDTDCVRIRAKGQKAAPAANMPVTQAPIEDNPATPAPMDAACDDLTPPTECPLKAGEFELFGTVKAVQPPKPGKKQHTIIMAGESGDVYAGTLDQRTADAANALLGQSVRLVYTVREWLGKQYKNAVELTKE